MKLLSNLISNKDNSPLVAQARKTKISRKESVAMVVFHLAFQWTKIGFSYDSELPGIYYPCASESLVRESNDDAAIQLEIKKGCHGLNIWLCY